MSPLSLEIETQESHVLIHGVVGLPGLSIAASDLTPAWPGVAKAVRDALAENFAAMGSIRGPWAALSLAYGRWKAAHFPGKKILELSGALKRSWTDEMGEGRQQIETPTELYITSTVAYGRFHQQGTSRMPARPFIVLSDRQKFRIGQAVHHALQRNVFGLPTPGARPSVRQALVGL